jgi:hypothetical protein
MTRLAYLIGLSGCGKSSLASRLATNCPCLLHIDTDDIRDRAAKHLAPRDNRPIDDSSRWEEHMRDFDVPELFGKLVADRHPAVLQKQQILAEGFMLGDSGWLAAFQEGLRRIDVAVQQESVFWLDPAPEEVLKKRKARNRSSQTGETLADVESHVQNYRERVTSCVDRRSASQDAIARSVAESLGLPC